MHGPVLPEIEKLEPRARHLLSVSWRIMFCFLQFTKTCILCIMAQEMLQSSAYPPPVVMPPPSRPASISSPSSSQSSGRKRKRDESALPSQRSSRLSSITTDPANETATRIERESDTFSETTRRRVERTAGSKCLHCDAMPVEICQVITRRDSAYSDLHEQGFPCLPSLTRMQCCAALSNLPRKFR